MKNINYRWLSILVLLFVSLAWAQNNSQDFYYYKGEKNFLDVNTNTISIVVNGTNGVSNIQSYFLNKTSYTISEIVEDNTRQAAIETDAEARRRKNIESYYFEVTLSQNLSLEDYFTKISELKNDLNALSVAPNYLVGEGTKLGLSNNFYVKLIDGRDIDKLYSKATEHNVEIIGHDKFMPLWFTISVKEGSNKNALQMANLFNEMKLFESSEPAFIYHDLADSNDPLFNQQWSLLNTSQNIGTPGIDINAEQAWSITTGTTSIRTAVYDHGFEMNHPDLQVNVFGTGYDANNQSSPAQIRGNHGTACAGIVGAVQDNGIGVSGVAPDSEMISISINLDFGDTPQQLASGFNWAWQNGADVMSNSFGGYSPSGIVDNAISNALANGRDGRGTVIVFSAGNDDNTNVKYPANSNPLIIVVGAMSPCGERKNPSSCDGESDWGSTYGTLLDVVAPGVKMPTTDRQGSNGYESGDYRLDFRGTSSACPVVAGVASLILSVNPDLTVQEVGDIIESTAQKVRSDLYPYATTSGRPNGTWYQQMGYGLVDAHEAVLLAQSLFCPEDLVITTNVPFGQEDIQKAENTVTASNIIFNNANAEYDAGVSVTLAPGFHAMDDSTFRAFIDGCTPTKPLKGENVSIVEEEIEIDEKVKSLKIFPNPTHGRFNLETNEDISYWELINQFGNLNRSGIVNANDAHSAEIDISNFPTGIYFLKVIFKDGTMIRKTVLKD